MSIGTQLNKSRSVGHVVATIGLIIGGFTFIYDLRESVAIQAFQLGSVENRLESVAIQTFQLDSVEKRLERVVARTDDQFGEIMDHLIRLEEKLDAIVLSGPTYQRPR